MSPACAEVLRGLLAPDPGRRATLGQALHHPWLTADLPLPLALMNMRLQVPRPPSPRPPPRPRTARTPQPEAACADATATARACSEWCPAAAARAVASSGAAAQGLPGSLAPPEMPAEWMAAVAAAAPTLATAPQRIRALYQQQVRSSGRPGKVVGPQHAVKHHFGSDLPACPTVAAGGVGCRNTWEITWIHNPWEWCTSQSVNSGAHSDEATAQRRGGRGRQGQPRCSQAGGRGGAAAVARAPAPGLRPTIRPRWQPSVAPAPPTARCPSGAEAAPALWGGAAHQA